MNWSPMVYALEQENIAITGRGTLDAQGASWHAMNKESRASRRLLLGMAAEGVPVEKRTFGEGHNLRPNFVQFYRCRNLLMEGLTLQNSPMWTLHFVLSRNITARGLTIRTRGPNTDGIDPESCSDVLIEECGFHTQDDGIAIKSGRNHDGRRINVPSQDIVIRNCRFEKISRNLFAIGSEVSGGVRNVYMEKCRLSSGLRGIFIKSNSARGGAVENLFFRDLEFESVREPVIRIGMDYGGEKGSFPPVFRNFHFEKIRARRAGWALEIAGLAGSPVENVTLRRCDFQEMSGPNRIQGACGLEIDGVTINGREAAL
jgi:polygalacturonase